jgi:hypothetical protein
MFVGKIEITVTGKALKIAKLRHEWFEYLQDAPAFIEEIKRAKIADALNFLQEAHVPRPAYAHLKEFGHASLVTFKDYDAWWNSLHFKARNKARKAQKSGVELKVVTVDDEFVRGIEKIYNECPVRQGRAFLHYGKNAATIKNDLASFPECTSYVGAYFEGRLIGFMKLFQGEDILRTVHIIATIADRDKCVMDALIAKGVEIASQRGLHHFHYGDWAYRGLGAFRVKFGFVCHDCPRYFVPLNAKGALALKLGMHRPLRERVPQNVKDRVANARNKWNAWRHGPKPEETKVVADD